MVETKVICKVEAQGTGDIVQLYYNELHTLYRLSSMYSLDDESAQMLSGNAQSSMVKSGG